MNTTPDDITLALWLDDELDGDARAAVDAWAAGQPEQLAAREENRRYKALLRTALPASIEPPAPEFFNARITRAIETAPVVTPDAGKVVAVPFWLNARAWFMPAAAAAGMVFAFWIGSRTTVPEAPANLADIPDVYVPESGVNAEWVSDNGANGGVIILSGVTAIPDSTDFTQTVYLPLPREIDRTAGGKDAPENVQ